MRGPVQVFNPQLIGGVASTFAWSPLDGCEDPATAIRRADAFAFAVSREGVEDAGFWSSKASDYLRGLFHAAALGGWDMRAVAAWVSPAADRDRPGHPRRQRPVIARLPRAWNNPAYRRARRRAPIPAPAPRPTRRNDPRPDPEPRPEPTLILTPGPWPGQGPGPRPEAESSRQPRLRRGPWPRENQGFAAGPERGPVPPSPGWPNPVISNGPPLPWDRP